MTLSVHAESPFDYFDLFEEKIGQIMKKYPEINRCLYGRSKMEKFANRYFAGSQVLCENLRLSRIKIQNLYKIVEQSDLTVFFFRGDLRGGYMATSKTISRAENLNKDFLVFNYELGDSWDNKDKHT